jgi:ribonuclease BN (tRNA processing enzyme)
LEGFDVRPATTLGPLHTFAYVRFWRISAGSKRRNTREMNGSFRRFLPQSRHSAYGRGCVGSCGGTSYLVDFGPGVIRRAQAAYEKGVAAVGCGAINLRTAFLTHLHMDHTAGYPDLILTPWIMGRRKPLEVFGPIGLRAMTRHVLQAWRVDIENRINGPDKLPPTGCRVNVHEIASGLVYEDTNISITAFPVSHGELRNAFGFRFETPDKSIVVSGDTAPTQTIEEHCEGCDVLIHEVYSQDTYAKVSRKWQAYRRKYHTSSIELAELASRVKPGLLVLYHRANAGGGLALPNPEQVVIEEMRHIYEGKVVTAHDLDIF